MPSITNQIESKHSHLKDLKPRSNNLFDQLTD